MFAPFLEIRLSDVVDILLVTSLLYTAVVWIRRTQAALVAGGILLLGVLYFVARILDLRLTAWIFQGFFAVFLIIVVVIFQEELRQLFERLAVWSLRRRNAVPHSDAADILVRCMTDFAKERIGALIVLPGKQPLARHIEGGIELNGVLSVPLLKSIFDPHSAGHDGAVVVEQDRIVRFAVHLPLSKNFQQLSGAGTRHSAALGLAERTDALCLVVSEERGMISVACAGRLQTVANPQEIGLLIERFADQQRPSSNQRRPMLRLVRENWLEKVASLAMVMGLWYLLVPGSRTIEHTYSIPVTVSNLASDLELESVDPPRVDATFSGLIRHFYLFDTAKLSITIDVSLAQLGRRTFEILEQNVRYPNDLTLESLKPSEVKISVRKVSAAAAAKPPANGEPGAKKSNGG